MTDKIYSLTMQPGIKRDVTNFSSPYWIDGKWCRFYDGMPRKIDGYSQLDIVANVPRGTYVVPISPNFNVYLGDSDNLKFLPIDQNGQPLGALVDRTPILFAGNAYNIWTFDTMFSTVDNESILIAHAAPNLFSIDSNVESPIYYGDSFGVAPLVETGLSVSGGIVVLHPYLFMYGNDGEIAWSMANDPTTIMDSARVTGRKVVAGFATRGGNTSPAGIFWSLDSVIRATQVGTSDIEFSFDTVTSDSSILSSRGIVEYDGQYYWAGVDRFLVYNGIVQELPNQLNHNFFFENLNYNQRQKVWATKETQWGEIWWFFPKGSSEECNHAVIYNVREQTWYDTPVNRGSGYFEQTFSYPIWTDTVNSGAGYPVWIHGIGFDQNVNGTLTAIDSYVESGNIAWCGTSPNGQNQEVDRWVYLYRFEPDLLQSGDMSLIVNGRKYARSSVESSSPYSFSDTTEKIDLREQRREMTLKLESNAVGGFYQLGRCLMVMRLGDERQ